MIKYELIVPYRKHSLIECDEIMRQYHNENRNEKPLGLERDQQEIYREWIESSVHECRIPLTNWELSFLSSVLDQLDRYGELTSRQAIILERIYTEKV